MPTLARGAMRSYALLLSLALAGTGAPRALQAQDLMTSVSDKHMESVLGDMGLTFSKGKQDHTWKVTLGDQNVILSLKNDNTDALLYTYIDVLTSPSKMNEWNKSKRFSRAYSDDDSNPSIESDLDFAGGVSDETIKAWIKLYRSGVTQFANFVKS